MKKIKGNNTQMLAGYGHRNATSKEKVYPSAQFQKGDSLNWTSNLFNSYLEVRKCKLT